MVSSEYSSVVPDASALSGWRKSSYSGGGQGECLEVADGYATLPVRDSRAVHGPAVIFSTTGWSSFVSAVKSGFTTG